MFVWQSLAINLGLQQTLISRTVTPADFPNELWGGTGEESKLLVITDEKVMYCRMLSFWTDLATTNSSQMYTARTNKFIIHSNFKPYESTEVCLGSCKRVIFIHYVVKNQWSMF